MQGDRIELGEHVDAGDAGVDAIAYGDVNQPVFARDGDGGLGAVAGERVEA